MSLSVDQGLKKKCFVVVVLVVCACVVVLVVLVDVFRGWGEPTSMPEPGYTSEVLTQYIFFFFPFAYKIQKQTNKKQKTLRILHLREMTGSY